MPARRPGACWFGFAILPVLLAGCAAPGPGSTPGAPAPAGAAALLRGDDAAVPFFAQRPLKSPEGATEWLRLHGQGTQIFRCELRAGVHKWINRLPEAELRDADGKLTARHGANQTFEHVDGSRLVGEVADHVPAPQDGALPWLLLKTRSFGKGTLVGVSYIERINTAGGMPPESCDATQDNQLLRVSFSADFLFFR
jgi:hypothetical protein